MQNKSNNSSNYNINKSKASTSDKLLIEENLKLKQQNKNYRIKSIKFTKIIKK